MLMLNPFSRIRVLEAALLLTLEVSLDHAKLTGHFDHVLLYRDIRNSLRSEQSKSEVENLLKSVANRLVKLKRRGISKSI